MLSNDSEIDRITDQTSICVKLFAYAFPIAGIPDEVIEQVFVEVDHCDPIAVTLRARGTYRCLLMGLPRAPDDSDSDKLDQSRC